MQISDIRPLALVSPWWSFFRASREQGLWEGIWAPVALGGVRLRIAFGHFGSGVLSLSHCGINRCKHRFNLISDLKLGACLNLLLQGNEG
jgi:hypothetical protein